MKEGTGKRGKRHGSAAAFTGMAAQRRARKCIHSLHPSKEARKQGTSGGLSKAKQSEINSSKVKAAAARFRSGPEELFRG